MERADSYVFYSVDVWIKSVATFGVALVTFVVLFLLAWRNGRTYCNTICPVGTVLGFCRSMLYLNLVLIPINVMVADYAHVNARLLASTLRIMRSIIPLRDLYGLFG